MCFQRLPFSPPVPSLLFCFSHEDTIHTPLALSERLIWRRGLVWCCILSTDGWLFLLSHCWQKKHDFTLDTFPSTIFFLYICWIVIWKSASYPPICLNVWVLRQHILICSWFLVYSLDMILHRPSSVPTLKNVNICFFLNLSNCQDQWNTNEKDLLLYSESNGHGRRSDS